MKSRIAIVAGGFVVGLAALAPAQNSPNPKGPANPSPQQNPPGQFGQLPPGIGAGAANQAAVRAAMMKQFDRDGDGKLSPQEQLAATKAMQQRGIRTPGMPNLVGPGNNQGNGPQSGPGVPQAAPPPAKKLGRREEILLKRFDKDGDGKLNEEEKTAARAELGQKNKEKK